MGMSYMYLTNVCFIAFAVRTQSMLLISMRAGLRAIGRHVTVLSLFTRLRVGVSSIPLGGAISRIDGVISL